MIRFFFIFLTISSIAFASQRNFSKIEKVIQVTDLNSKIAEDFFRGKFPDTALECKKGIKLPIKIFANLNYLSLDFVPNLTVCTEKDCYIRFVGKKGYISYDLINWERAKKILNAMLTTKFRVNQESSQIEVKTEYVDTKLPRFEY